MAVTLTDPSRSWAQKDQSPRKIAEGDVIKIDVAGRQDLSGQFTVDSQGMIMVPILGSIKAEGRTTTELTTELSRRISLIQREIPILTVTIAETSAQRIYVLGSVLLPGSFPSSADMTVWHAIARAGGPTEDADLSNVEIIPAELGAAPQKVDVGAAIRSGTLESLPRLRPGDTVRVARLTALGGGASQVVYVMGAVANQGAHPFEDGMDLAKLLGESVPSPEANIHWVEIVRTAGGHATRMKVDMKEYFGRANLVGNPELQAGDTVYIHRQSKYGFLGILPIVGSVLGIATSIAVLTN